ncbi:MAG: aspartate aminotransferase family protein [Actinobacteria bacterium]|nr:aspartate aminotransferase family protein [Actinomycetota bacterium]
MSALWHPFADMSVSAGEKVVLQRGEGCRIWDEAGNEYLDATAGLWFCNVGYGRRDLIEQAAAQMGRLPAYSTFDVYANRPALELADRIATLAPTAGPSGVFFTSGGSDGVDTAAKIARRYWQVAGEPQRTVVISRDGAYHGMNAYGTSLAGISGNHDGWGPLVADVVNVPAQDPAALERALAEHAGRVAAFIGEPVIGAGGVRPPAPGYWERVQELCRRDDVLLIADEVVSGFGRFGVWFACEHYGIAPDMIVGAKGVTSGYQPLGFVACGDRVRSLLWEQGGVFRHGYTYSGHPVACAVGLANLELIEIESLRPRVEALTPVLSRVLTELEREPGVAGVRSAGLLGAVDLAGAEADPGLPGRVVAAARARGLLIRALAGGSLQISPSFVISEVELERIGETIAAALEAVGVAEVGR